MLGLIDTAIGDRADRPSLSEYSSRAENPLQVGVQYCTLLPWRHRTPRSEERRRGRSAS